MTKTVESLQCVCLSIFRCEPPWRLGHEPDESSSYGSKPILCAKDSTVCPTVGVHSSGVDNERNCKWPEGVRESSQAGQHASKFQRSDLADVCYGNRCQGTDNEAIQKLATEEELICCRNKFHGDSGESDCETNHDH